MSKPEIEPIAAADADTAAALLSLNNAHAEETSFLTMAEWRALVAAAYAATRVGGAAALMIAFDETAAYEGVNFRWFGARYERFVYVDRIIVAAQARGAGLARVLYEDLFERMRASGHATLACEVNAVPPNPGSEAFHARMGFREVGSAELKDRAKTVKYLIKELS